MGNLYIKMGFRPVMKFLVETIDFTNKGIRIDDIVELFKKDLRVISIRKTGVCGTLEVCMRELYKNSILEVVEDIEHKLNLSVLKDLTRKETYGMINMLDK